MSLKQWHRNLHTYYYYTYNMVCYLSLSFFCAYTSLVGPSSSVCVIIVVVVICRCSFCFRARSLNCLFVWMNDKWWPFFVSNRSSFITVNILKWEMVNDSNPNIFGSFLSTAPWRLVQSARHILSQSICNRSDLELPFPRGTSSTANRFDYSRKWCDIS